MSLLESSDTILSTTKTTTPETKSSIDRKFYEYHGNPDDIKASLDRLLRNERIIIETSTNDNSCRISEGLNPLTIEVDLRNTESRNSHPIVYSINKKTGIIVSILNPNKKTKAPPLMKVLRDFAGYNNYIKRILYDPAYSYNRDETTH